MQLSSMLALALLVASAFSRDYCPILKEDLGGSYCPILKEDLGGSCNELDDGFVLAVSPSDPPLTYGGHTFDDDLNQTVSAINVCLLALYGNQPVTIPSVPNNKSRIVYSTNGRKFSHWNGACGSGECDNCTNSVILSAGFDWDNQFTLGSTCGGDNDLDYGTRALFCRFDTFPAYCPIVKEDLGGSCTELDSGSGFLLHASPSGPPLTYGGHTFDDNRDIISAINVCLLALYGNQPVTIPSVPNNNSFLVPGDDSFSHWNGNCRSGQCDNCTNSVILSAGFDWDNQFTLGNTCGGDNDLDAGTLALFCLFDTFPADVAAPPTILTPEPEVCKPPRPYGREVCKLPRPYGCDKRISFQARSSPKPVRGSLKTLGDGNLDTFVKWHHSYDGLTITLKLKKHSFGHRFRGHWFGDYDDHEVCAVSLVATNTDKTPKGCTVYYKPHDAKTWHQFGDACPGEYSTAEHPPFTPSKYNTLPCGDDHTSVAAESIKIHCNGTFDHDGYSILKDIYVYTWDEYGDS